MRPSPTIGTLSTSVLILACAAVVQGQNGAAAVVAATQGSNGGGAASKWPSNLLLVGVEGQPARVPMGTTSENALKWARFWYPHNESLALKALKNTRSELGEADVTVQPFYLSKFPVTNEQYYRFVKATGHRFPFHWWRDGAKDNFEQHRQKAFKAFPNLLPSDRVNAPVYYWEDYWKSEKLEYAIPKGEEKYPVNFVSWRDALAFCAWAGMRLPTEPEWTFAANGGERKEFVFGNDWSDAILKDLQMKDGRNIDLKPVGAMGQKAIGPFGHADLVGQVWEWVIPLGYNPQTSQELFDSENKKLLRDKKLGAKLLSDTAAFKPEFAIAKGGCFLSFSTQDYVQTRINCRAPLATEQTMKGLGFRVAKTRRPAYDMSLSRLRGGEYPGFLPPDKEPSLPNQIGWESYDLEGDGQIIANYHAISLVPMGFLSSKKSPRLTQVRDEAQETPLELGVLLTTETLASPAVAPGTYVVYLRRAGLPKAVKDALRDAHKELVAEDKAKKRAEKAGKKPKKEKEEDPEPAKDDKKEKKSKWRQVLRPYGYSDEELLANSAADLAKYVYVRHTGSEVEKGKGKDLFKVDTESNQLLLRSKDGRWMTAVSTKVDVGGFVSDDPAPTITEPANGAVSISFPVPVDRKEMDKKNRRKAVVFQLDLQLK